MSTPIPPRGAWYRFRLRTLLFVVAIVAIPLGWIANSATSRPPCVTRRREITELGQVLKSFLRRTSSIVACHPYPRKSIADIHNNCAIRICLGQMQFPQARKSERVKIRLKFQQNKSGQDVVPPTMPGTQVAGVGDEVRIDNSIHKIVNIVAPNEKTKVVGWFELSKESKDAPPAEKTTKASDRKNSEVSTKASPSP
jgi:hypothetical protein